MTRAKSLVLCLASAAILTGCALPVQWQTRSASANRAAVRPDAQTVLQQFRSENLTDPRTSVFTVTAAQDADRVTLSGRYDRPELFAGLVRALRSAGYFVLNRTELLGDPEKLAGKPWAIVRVPVATLNSAPAFASDASTQAIAGTVVRVLEEVGLWVRVQTPDGYIAWIHRGQIVRLDQKELARWNRAPKLVVTSLSATVRELNRQAPVTELTLGSTVRFLTDRGDSYLIQLPDGRYGRIARGQAEWLTTVQSRMNALKKNPTRFAGYLTVQAQKLMGRSYLWAGSSVYGMDCSGFIGLILRQADTIAPRDADELARMSPKRLNEGNPDADFAPGTLLVFGSKNGGAASVTHVALSLGGSRFIHSLTDVHTGSFSAKDADFDEVNRARFLWGIPLNPTDYTKDGQTDPCFSGSAVHPFHQIPPRPLTPCRLKNP